MQDQLNRMEAAMFNLENTCRVSSCIEFHRKERSHTSSY